MGWETRRNGRFYYEARKIDGRVVKTYHSNRFGTADALHELHALERQQAELARMVQRAEFADWAEADVEVQTVFEQLGAFVDAVLIAAGYHRHDRRAWRKKRVDKEATSTTALTTASSVAVPAAPAVEADGSPQSKSFVVPSDKAERRALVRAGLPESSSPQAKARALACIYQYPGEIELATGKTILPILSLLSDAGRPVEQAIREQEVGKMRRELEGDNPTPLEKMLVERVVACWLAVALYETEFARKAREGMTAATDAFLQKRIDRAHNRHLSAVKTLAQVRRLQVPLTVQVNLAADGGQQVNVAGGLLAEKGA